MFAKSFIQAIATTTMLVGTANAVFNNTVFIISNAETRSLNVPGLSQVGFERASSCIPSTFSPLDVGLIITCPFDAKAGLCADTEATAAPVAAALGLTPNISCGAGGATSDDCLTDLLKNFAKNSTQSILLIWDLNAMNDLFESLGVDNDVSGDDDSVGTQEDPDDGTPHYDVINTVIKSAVKELISMNCTGIDGQAPGTFRRRSLPKTFNLKKKRSTQSKVARMINFWSSN